MISAKIVATVCATAAFAIASRIDATAGKISAIDAKIDVIAWRIAGIVDARADS